MDFTSWPRLCGRFWCLLAVKSIKSYGRVKQGEEASNNKEKKGDDGLAIAQAPRANQFVVMCKDHASERPSWTLVRLQKRTHGAEMFLIKLEREGGRAK